MVMPKLGVKNIIAAWPEDSREIARQIIDKYGEPNEATPSLLVWYNNGPWKRTVVYRNTVRHNFPMPHSDGLEQFVDHEVPMEKACEILAFNGSVALYCTRGEISACCHDEKVNFLALNLAHDILTDKKTFEQAREIFVNAVKAYQNHKTVPYMDKLQFNPGKDTADPDESSLSEEDLKIAPA